MVGHIKPWQSIVALLILLLPSLFFVSKVSPNNHMYLYYEKDDPKLVFEKQVRDTFANDTIYILLFQGDDLLEANFLGRLHKLTEDLSSLEFVAKVTSPTNVDHIEASADGFEVTPLIDVDADEFSQQSIKSRITKDRFAKGILLADDARTLAVVVEPVAGEVKEFYEPLEQQIRKQVVQNKLDDHLKGVSGMSAVVAADTRSMARDTQILLPLSFLLGILVLWWMFRSYVVVAFGLVSLTVTVVSTISLYGIFNVPFTAVSEMVPSLISALTIAFLVHLFNSVYFWHDKGLSVEESVKNAMQDVRSPSLFAALTTIAGFVSLVTTRIPPVQSFGWVVSVGLVVIYVVVIWLMPPLVAKFLTFPEKVKKSGLRGLDTVVWGIAKIGLRHPKWVIAGHVLAILILAPVLFAIRVETNFIEFFKPNHEIRKSTDLVEKNLSGTASIDVVFSLDHLDGLKSPEKLQVIKNFKDWVEKLPEVDKAVSPVEVIEDMHWAYNGEKEGYRTLPDDRELITQYLFINSGEDLYDLVNRDFTQARVGLRMKSLGSIKLKGVLQNIENYLSKNCPEDLSWKLAGSTFLEVSLLDTLIEDQERGVLVAIILVLGMMAFLFRSFSGSIMCMIPNVLPIFVCFVAMGLSNIALDLATITISGITLGIAVDDTIHVFHGFLHRMRKGQSKLWAMARTFKQAGRAITVTTLILLAQYLVFLTATYRPVNYFGLLMAVGVASALLFDLLLLPALIQAFWRKSKREQNSSRDTAITKRHAA
ncbi:MAG: MMPL family transporter [Pseudobdellovibrionaceae bacterium]|nr:MAG: MMPL family transporter [Pseudobdellovibrionaceae bacterium]